MTIRPRTLRRLGAFLLIVAAVAAVTMVLQDRRSRHRDARLLEQRRLGLEAVSVGDYATGLAALEEYLLNFNSRRAETDFDARLNYAHARARNYEVGERHLEQAGRMLRDLADDLPQAPRRLEALHLLMEVTAVGGDWQELRRQCDEALAQHPQDLFSLRMRREAFEQLGETEMALADSQALVDLAPKDVDEQIRLLRLLARLGHPAEQIVTRAVSLAASNPSDPHFLLVLAVAYRNAGQSQQALTCLRQASEFELPGEEVVGFVVRLAGLFDALGEHDEAREAYAQAVLRLPVQDPAGNRLRQLLALRLWQTGELERGLDLVTGDAPGNLQDVVLLATRTTLLFEKGDNAQAQQSLASLARLTDAATAPEIRRQAIAWHEGLSAAYAADDRSRRVRLEALLRSQARIEDLRPLDSLLAIDEPGGLLTKWTADQYAMLGELQMAMLYWRRAGVMMPGWDEPWLRVAEASVQLGLEREAQAAVQAAEHLVEGTARERLQVLRARIAYQQWLRNPSSAGRVRAAALAAAHQRSSPLHPDTLPAHVHLTSRSDASEARRIIRQRLELGADASLRAQLGEVSRLAGLEMETELFGDVPERASVLLHAGLTEASGDLSGALALLEAVPAEERGVEGGLARARLLSLLDAPVLAEAWRELATSHSQNLEVQLALLEAPGVRERAPQLTSKTIDRLAELTGPTAVRWRLERARWLLGHGTRDAALDAAQLLRAQIRHLGGGAGSVEPRMLLAQALLQLGSPAMAREHLEAALALDPSRADVGLRLARLYEEVGKWDDARDLLLRLAAAGAGPVKQRVEVAVELAALGFEQAAIALLKQAQETGQVDKSSQVSLASWLHRTGRLREAETAFEALVEDNDSTEALLGAAAFFASTGRSDRADAMLVRLESLQTSDVERHQARAACLGRMGDHSRARDALALAVARLPRSAEPWIQAATLELACGDAAAAIEILRRAKDAGLQDQRLALLEVQASALSQAPSNDTPAQLEALASALGALEDSSTWGATNTALLAAAGALRDRRVPTLEELLHLERAALALQHYGPLHITLAGFFQARQMPAERLRAARRAAEALVHDPAAQRLAFEAARDLGATSQARLFAVRWQKSAGADPLLAGAALAEAHLLGGDYAAAHETILPFAGRPGDAGTESQRLLMLVAEIHAARGDYPEAWGRISPHLVESPAWRSVAVRCAADRLANVRVASRWLEGVEEALDISDEAGSASGALERLAVARAWVRLGIRLEERTALERGRDQMSQLAAGPAAQNVEAWEVLAEAALALGSDADAETALRRVLALNLQRPKAADALAHLLSAAGAPAASREAQTWAGMAIEQSPGSADFYATLGRAYLATRSLSEAEEAFERALNLEETNLNALLGLGRVLVLGQEDEVAAALFSILLPIYRSEEPREVELRQDFDMLSGMFGSRASSNR